MIKKDEMKIIENFMLEDLREWVHYHYAPCTNEEFIKQYYLRLYHENGEDMASQFVYLLRELIKFDIYDLF